MRSLCAALAFFACAAFAAAPGVEVKPVEAVGLRSIAAWLNRAGVEGYLGPDVAEAIGIAREATEKPLAARQRGFRNDAVLRIAQVVGGDYLVFMVQGPGDEVRFYLSTVNGGLRKALVATRGLVAPLDPMDAAAGFRGEVIYWEDRAAGR